MVCSPGYFLFYFFYKWADTLRKKSSRYHIVGLRPSYSYMHSRAIQWNRLPMLQYWANLVKVGMYISVHETLKTYGFPIQICDRIWENRMRFFLKIEVDVWLISPTIELTRIQVLDRSHVLLWSYRALRSRHTPNNQEITHCFARVWYFRILCVYWKWIKWTWVEPFKMNTKIERRSNFDLDNKSRFFDT